MSLNIHIEGKAGDYTIHAQNDRGELYVIEARDGGWGDLKFFLNGELYETIPVEGKDLERALTEYVIPDLT